MVYLRRGIHGMFPLHLAALSGFSDCCRKLLSSGRICFKNLMVALYFGFFWWGVSWCVFVCFNLFHRLTFNLVMQEKSSEFANSLSSVLGCF